MTNPLPCLYLNPPLLSRLQRDRAANTPQWQLLASVASQIAAGFESNDPSARWEPRHDLPPALYWLLAGDERIGRLTAADLCQQADPNNDYVSIDDYYNFRYLPYYAAACHWTWPLMTEAQRAQVNTWMMNLVGWLWPETRAAVTTFPWGPAKPPGFGIDYDASNYFHGFLAGTSAVLHHVLATEHDTGEPNRVDDYLANFDQRIADHLLPYFEERLHGGVTPEGTGYDGAQYHAQTELASRSVTGISLLPSWYWDDWALWIVHQTMPGGQRFYPYGLQPGHSDAGFQSVNRLRAACVLPLCSETAASLLRGWLGRITPRESRDPANAVWEFIGVDPTGAKAGPA